MRRVNHLTRTALSALVALALTTGGCGDEVIQAVGGGPIDGGALDAGGTVDVPILPGQDVFTPNAEGREIILLHDTSKPVPLIITEQLVIRAKVLDYRIGGPAVNAPVGFSIVDDGGGGDGSLTSNQAWTDPDGMVSVTFRANFAADVTYTIQLATDGAEPVTLEIYVSDQPKGDIKVNLQYEGPIAIKNVHVRLLPGSFTCGQFKATSVPDTPLSEKTVLGLGTGDTGAVSFEKLPDGQKFTIVATAQSPKGSLAAAGCLDGVLVIGNEENTVTMTMYLLVLNPAGAYDTTNVFDFTGAIPGELGELVDSIVTLFNNPGKFLIDQVKNLVSNYLGELITDIAFGLFEDELAAIITNWMLNESPDWIQDIFTIGQDLTQVVNNLEMEATLVISKLSNDYYVQGVLYWTGISLYWKLGCPKQGEPGYDPACGKNTFSISDFASTQFPMDIIEGKFTGLIHDFDQLDIDNHVIKINYGKLIIFVLNEIILPAVSGEHNLTDAILSFVNCGSIAATFSNSVLDGIGISESDIEGFCEDGITWIVKPIEWIIGGLALDSQLRLSGRAVLVDSDSDLVVDEIIDGIYLGHIEVDGQEGPSFDGYWFAWRQEGQ